MKFKEDKEKEWQEGLDVNKDGYGRAVYIYAQRWAEMMETSIKDGDKLEDIANDLSHEADKEGITGFQYGCVVSILASVWIHGEQLRIWHNLKIQLKDEGEKANKSGAVLNPAILNVDAEALERIKKMGKKK